MDCATVDVSDEAIESMSGTALSGIAKNIGLPTKPNDSENQLKRRIRALRDQKLGTAEVEQVSRLIPISSCDC